MSAPYGSLSGDNLGYTVLFCRNGGILHSWRTLEGDEPNAENYN